MEVSLWMVSFARSPPWSPMTFTVQSSIFYMHDICSNSCSESSCAEVSWLVPNWMPDHLSPPTPSIPNPQCPFVPWIPSSHAVCTKTLHKALCYGFLLCTVDTPKVSSVSPKCRELIYMAQSPFSDALGYKSRLHNVAGAHLRLEARKTGQGKGQPVSVLPLCVFWGSYHGVGSPSCPRDKACCSTSQRNRCSPRCCDHGRWLYLSRAWHLGCGMS